MTYEPVDMKQLYFIFIVGAVGLIISSVLFIGEMLSTFKSIGILIDRIKHFHFWTSSFLKRMFGIAINLMMKNFWTLNKYFFKFLMHLPKVECRFISILWITFCIVILAGHKLYLKYQKKTLFHY